MYYYQQQIRTNYQMSAPPNEPPSQKSRGHELFVRQAKLYGENRDQPPTLLLPDVRTATPPLRQAHTNISAPYSASPATNQVYQNSPSLMPLPSSLSSNESYAHSGDSNVKLISIQPRPELTYIKDTLMSPQPSAYHKTASALQETDFPLHDHSTVKEPEQLKREQIKPSDSTCATVVEEVSTRLSTYDDDDDVIHQDDTNNSSDNDEDNDEDDNQRDASSESFDDEENSVNTNVNDTTVNAPHGLKRSDAQIIPPTGLHDRQNNRAFNEEKLKENTLHMAYSTRGAVIEEYDKDCDNSSPEEDEQPANKDLTNEYDEQHKEHLIIRQKQILWSIVQEWLRKEKCYSDELRQMENQISQIQIQKDLKISIETLLEQHLKLQQQIEDLYDSSHEPSLLIKHLTQAVATLIGILPIYDDYFRLFSTSVRKSLEKRINTNGLSIEDILSIPAKQFLQIMSQVQDLYQTAHSLEPDDKENISQLYNQVQLCKVYGARQEETINKVILKSEEVGTIASRGHRDRCRLILYPDAIVGCTLKTKILASPKYTLLWFIPILDLQWTISQDAFDDTTDTGDELKTNLKSVYQELEKTQKNNNVLAARLSKNIRKQENELNLAQSKLQLNLSVLSRGSPSPTILFSSAYQLEDWVDLIDKTKQELMDRSSPLLNSNSTPIRVNDSLIQKRLDLIKPNLYEANLSEASSTIQTFSFSKTYTGTLCITIHNVNGSALYNPTRQYQVLPDMSSLQQQIQKTNLFCVAVEIDSYSSFNTHAKTRPQKMIQAEMVEFKDEVFQIELECSRALRFLIYRIDSTTADARSGAQRETCIGKFHRDIEIALKECQDSVHQAIYLESQTGDLKLKVSLVYSKREEKFKRTASKRSLAVFGRSIEKLMSTPNGQSSKGIPRIICTCVELVEREGLNETGIYRVCCVASDLQKLRNQFDRDYRRGEEMLAQKNIHVAANLLKLFFRELPEPLFTSTLYTQFINAIQLDDAKNQAIALQQTFKLLDDNNQKILLYLFKHLILVSEHSQVNMMHLDNLALVFGPTLMRPSKLMTTNPNSQQPLYVIGNNSGPSAAADFDQMSSELQGSMYQCQVVLACLKLTNNNEL